MIEIVAYAILGIIAFFAGEYAAVWLYKALRRQKSSE